MNHPGLLANAVLVLHVAFIAFVVFGLVAVLVGIPCRWRWTRRLWWRLTHLACIGVVIVQAWAGVMCPLTILENRLREAAGQDTYATGFIAHWLRRIIFFDAEPWAFTLVYTLFGGLVLVAWLMAPPIWRSSPGAGPRPGG